MLSEPGPFFIFTLSHSPPHSLSLRFHQKGSPWSTLASEATRASNESSQNHENFPESFVATFNFSHHSRHACNRPRPYPKKISSNTPGTKLLRRVFCFFHVSRNGPPISLSLRYLAEDEFPLFPTYSLAF